MRLKKSIKQLKIYQILKKWNFFKKRLDILKIMSYNTMYVFKKEHIHLKIYQNLRNVEKSQKKLKKVLT